MEAYFDRRIKEEPLGFFLNSNFCNDDDINSKIDFTIQDEPIDDLSFNFNSRIKYQSLSTIGNNTLNSDINSELDIIYDEPIEFENLSAHLDSKIKNSKSHAKKNEFFISDVKIFVKELQLFLERNEFEMKNMQENLQKMRKSHTENLILTFKLLELLSVVSSSADESAEIEEQEIDIRNHDATFVESECNLKSGRDCTQEKALDIYIKEELLSNTCTGTLQGTPDSGAYSYGETEDHVQSHNGHEDFNDSTGEQIMVVTPVMMGLMQSDSHHSSDSSESISETPRVRKPWTNEDMKKALDSLRDSKMSLSRTSQVFGIPATTLWKRAHKMGIETPKKEKDKMWSQHNLCCALEEMRRGRLSAYRASKEFGIPTSTLYKIAHKKGVKLSSFASVQSSWNSEDLDKAFKAIGDGMSVQKAAQEYGIPSGTLYGKCRKKGIDLNQGVSWSVENMKEAIEAVRVGNMSMNQAAIFYNLPYSTLYVRCKRGKFEDGLPLHQEMTIGPHPDPQTQSRHQQL